jgi:hypothetical protein
VKRRVKCFEDELIRGESYAIMDAGLRVVEVKRITGTVDKCGELDEQFHYVKRHDRHERNRRYHVKQAFQRNIFFPPVDLYFYRGEYYVVDGNRRVAAAREMGIDYIDAKVTEYISRKNYIEVAGAMYRRKFESLTGIRNIALTHENGFEILLREVEDHVEGDDVAVRGRNWYSQEFLPRCKKIEKSVLPHHYGDIQVGDIYVLIGEFYRNFMGGIPEGADYGTVISGFVFAHGLRRRRIFRGPFFKVISMLILRRVKKK